MLFYYLYLLSILEIIRFIFHFDVFMSPESKFLSILIFTPASIFRIS